MDKIDRIGLNEAMGKAVSFEIHYLVTNNILTGREIANKVGIPETRISEIKNGNYDRMNDGTFKRFLAFGIIKTDDVLRRGVLNREQKNHLKKMENRNNG